MDAQLLSKILPGCWLVWCRFPSPESSSTGQTGVILGSEKTVDERRCLKKRGKRRQEPLIYLGFDSRLLGKQQNGVGGFGLLLSTNLRFFHGSIARNKWIHDFERVDSVVSAEVFRKKPCDSAFETCGQNHRVPIRQAVSVQQNLCAIHDFPGRENRRPNRTHRTNVGPGLLPAVTERLQFSANRDVFARNLPRQCDVRQRLDQRCCNSLLPKVSRIMNVDQNVGVNGVHATRPE